MLKSKRDRLWVGIFSAIVVVVCLIGGALLFDGSSDISVDNGEIIEQTDVTEEIQDNATDISGESEDMTAAADAQDLPQTDDNQGTTQDSVGTVPTPSEANNHDVEITDPVVVTEGDLQLSIMTNILSQYDLTMLDEDNEEVVIDLSTVEFLPLYNLGTTDPSVAVIQSQLMDLGFMEAAEPTDYYGNITMDAVKMFQRQNDLKQDGIIGSETIAMIMNPEAKSYLVKKGMSGDDIKNIQLRLYELGYLDSKNDIIGDFGTDTENGVRALQSANGLVADGIIGSATIELLYYGDVKANLLSFGDKSDIILECQNQLRELGYLTTEPDGVYGNDTLAAVKLFQSRNDLVVDGYLGPSTREVLMSSSATPNGLVIGDEGDTVKRVQELLIKYGYMSKGSATGYFGEVTDAAVKSFQKNNGLSADGNVGRKTMAVLTGGSGKSSSGSSSGAVDTGSAGGGSVKALLKVALSKLGCKYVYGAKGPDKFDCSGFVYWCLNQVGVKQSYITSYGWRTVGKYKKITNYSDLKAGDIIVVTGHVGIIGENGTVIDASSSRSQIMHRSLSSWWSSRFICGWRIFG